MMEHNVEIVKEERYCIEYCIDGCPVTLNRTGASVDLTDTLTLSDTISCIEHALLCDASLITFANELNGKNLFRILDALFYDLAYQNWVRFFDYACDRGDKAFKRAFVEHYGFFYSFKSETSGLYYSIRAAAEERKHYVEVEEAHSEKYAIALQSIIGNVATYLINGDHYVEICLRGKPEFKYAKNVLSWLSSAKITIANGSCEEVERSISEIGGKAFLQFAQLFFDAECLQFLKRYVTEQVTERRVPLKPRKVLKHFFGIQLSDYYAGLLSEVEKMLPWANSFLVESNVKEMESSGLSWVLYDLHAGEVRRYTTTFVGTESYIKSVQSLCQREAKKRIISEQPYVQHVHSIAQDLSLSFASFSEIGLPIEDVSDITSIHLGGLRTYLSDKGYSVQTQRRVLYSLRTLYMFTIGNTSSTASPFSRLSVPQRTINPTQPLSTDQLLGIPETIKKAPSYIQIAMGLAIATGARANSICQLSVDDFSFSEDNNYVVFSLFKTLQKTVTRLRVQIDSVLAHQIKSYIAETSHLRSQLDHPYLLVYRPAGERSGSGRLPRVLSPNTFAYEVNKTFCDAPLYDSNGFPITCAFKTVRATYGRELFLAGLSEDEAARRMGNTASIKAKHYTTLFPKDDAKLHHDQYEKTIVPILQSSQAIIPMPHQEVVMYGTCNTGKICNPNNCATCEQLLKKRK